MEINPAKRIYLLSIQVLSVLFSAFFYQPAHSSADLARLVLLLYFLSMILIGPVSRADTQIASGCGSAPAARGTFAEIQS